MLWRYFESYESTDDAQVNGHMSAVGTRISGTIIGVYVENNQRVSEGQKLVDLDPTDYRVAVEQARAALTQARAELSAQNPNVPITQTVTSTTVATAQADVAGAEAAVMAAQMEYDSAVADLRQAEANNIQAQLEVARYRKLAEKDEISKEMWDEKVATAKANAALVDARRASSESARKIVAQRQEALVQARKRLSEARQNSPRRVSIQRANVASKQANTDVLKARLDKALLDLSYCVVVAPVPGIAGDRSAEVGQRVEAGDQLLVITQINDLWVTANFKETQIRRMRVGQPATIHVDALDRDFDGYVESFPGATGAKYSLLPPENATGNYVKVVQRLPVRIRFKPGLPRVQDLRPGMSVEPKVWLR
jgi:membrane fusion protein (multidrug efflux system)